MVAVAQVDVSSSPAQETTVSDNHNNPVDSDLNGDEVCKWQYLETVEAFGG